MNGRDCGDDPVAISTFLLGSISDSPSSYSTEIVPLWRKYRCSSNTVINIYMMMFHQLIDAFMQLLTIASLRSKILGN